MCKMLFIGTQTQIEEIPYDKSRPDYHVELVADEYLPVRNVFSNPFIYFVGTSRGCACDFGINSNAQMREMSNQKLSKRFHRLIDTNPKRERWQKENPEHAVREMEKYKAETLLLINLIESEIRKGNPVEIYCTWADDYAAQPEFREIVGTTMVKYF